jgi:hypothetical protein
VPKATVLPVPARPITTWTAPAGLVRLATIVHCSSGKEGRSAVTEGPVTEGPGSARAPGPPDRREVEALCRRGTPVVLLDGEGPRGHV